MNTSSIVTLILFATLLLPTSTRADNPTPRTVKIGVITDLSGKFSSWGKQTALGAQLAQHELRKDHIALEVIFEDSGSDTKRAASAAHKLISIDHVQALYAETSAVSIAVSAVAKPFDIPLLYIALARTPLATNPNAWKSYADATPGCRAVANLWREMGIARVAMIKLSLEPAELCYEGLKEVYPNAFITEYNPGDDVSTQVLRTQQQNAQAVVNIGYEPDAQNFFKALGRLNFTPLVQITDITTTPVVRSTMSPGLNEKVFFYGTQTLPKSFLDQISHADPKNELVNIEGAAYAYLHLRQLAQALARCREKDNQCFAQALQESPKSELLGFGGWTKDRSALIGVGIYRWQDGTRIHLKNVDTSGWR